MPSRIACLFPHRTLALMLSLSACRNLHGKHNSAVCGGTFLHSDNFGWAQLRTAAVQCNACLADSGQRQKLIG